ncbi:MAG: type IV toxin-antitoxin system AbiEi family antitoxin domain-containing protein [Muribaculaceae bacterium]|nr:type IV toxin-antitoxin system AbiEi family antitoxin domain-containing protein [Muribaculaceae bacterium]
MTAAQQIAKQVEALGSDRVFSIADLGLPVKWWENIRVKLSRMVKSGELVKLAPGKYYRPRISILGPVPPSTENLVRDILYKDGCEEGYLTTYSVWDSMGLTTQFSSVIVIGLNYRKDTIHRHGRVVQFILQPNKITAETIPLLQILDSIKFIKSIPDTSIANSIERLSDIIKIQDENQLKAMVDLAMKYPPRVRALLGAMLENNGNSAPTSTLHKSLNPLTEYRIGISEETLPTKKNWRIV